MKFSSGKTKNKCNKINNLQLKAIIIKLICSIKN